MGGQLASWKKISLFSPLHGIPSRKMYCGLFQEKKLASGGLWLPLAASGRLPWPPAESIEERSMVESIEDALVVSAKKGKKQKQKGETKLKAKNTH